MSESSATASASASAPPSGSAKDRHEPRGRKPNDHLPPSRAREVQRAFRLRRAEHLASLEERINALESENTQLRRLLNIPDAARPKIGTGPTGRGKSLKEGGVPMSERVRARKEAARRRERIARGETVEREDDNFDDLDLDLDMEGSDRDRDGSTLSPRGSMPPPSKKAAHMAPSNSSTSDVNANTSADNNAINSILPLFQPPMEAGPSFNYQLPMPFQNTPMTPDNPFTDFESAIFKPTTGPTPNFMFNLFGENSSLAAQNQPQHSQHMPDLRKSPISPPLTNPPPTPAQPELLTRLKQCCHLSDSHVVNDPGLLIFATRLCQSFPCSFGGVHPDGHMAISDGEHLLLDDSWRVLRNQLDPGTEIDGENRINTGRMAAELVIRAAHSRGAGGWILCRFREGMSVRRSLVAGLINGLGGKFE